MTHGSGSVVEGKGSSRWKEQHKAKGTLPLGLLREAVVALPPSPQWLWSKGRHWSPVPATTSMLRTGSRGSVRLFSRYTFLLLVSDR